MFDGFAIGIEEVLFVVLEVVVSGAEFNEVWVLECFLGGHSLLCVHFETGFHEGETVLLDFAQVTFLQRLSFLDFLQMDVREFWVLLHVAFLLLSEFSNGFAQQMQLIDFILAWKHGLAINQLTNNTA